MLETKPCLSQLGMEGAAGELQSSGYADLMLRVVGKPQGFWCTDSFAVSQSAGAYSITT